MKKYKRSDQTKDFQPFSPSRLPLLVGLRSGFTAYCAFSFCCSSKAFKSANHLSSWAGMCSGNHESAGKQLSGKSRKGSPWLRKILVEAAHAGAHTKNPYLSSQYRRRAGGHSILVIIYHVLREKEGYKELAGNYFDEHNRHAIEKRWFGGWRNWAIRYHDKPSLRLPEPYFSEEYQEWP
jgi:hypothetical protein